MKIFLLCVLGGGIAGWLLFSFAKWKFRTPQSR